MSYELNARERSSTESVAHPGLPRLIDEVHARGMKIAFAMVLNHTSDRHPWFLESRSSRESGRRDDYIGRDGRKPGRRAAPSSPSLCTYRS